MQVSRKYVQCLSPAGLHRMSYKEWGDSQNPKVLVCVHGLTRVADDFDVLAQSLMQEYRVVCPDIVGRGQSDWLSNPQFYQIPQYVSDMVTLLARLDAQTVDWIGTSMGGLIGIGVASMTNNPIRKLVLNDVGPTLNASAIQRIGKYLGKEMCFNTFEQAEVYIRQISIPFGPHNEVQWQKIARDVLKQDSQGHWKLHYDLKLAIPFCAITPEIAAAGQATLWASYDAITCSTLLIHGAKSDLLSLETAQQMGLRGPCATMVEIAGVSHAPTLVNEEQIAIVKKFLLS